MTTDNNDDNTPVDASEMIAAINKMLSEKAQGGGEQEFDREFESNIKEMEGLSHMTTIMALKDLAKSDIEKMPAMLMDLLSGSSTLSFSESESYRKHPLIKVLGNKAGVSEAVTSIGPLMPGTPETLRRLEAQVARLVAQIDLNSGKPQAQMASIAVLVSLAQCCKLLMEQLVGVMNRHKDEIDNMRSA